MRTASLNLNFTASWKKSVLNNKKTAQWVHEPIQIVVCESMGVVSGVALIPIS